MRTLTLALLALAISLSACSRSENETTMQPPPVSAPQPPAVAPARVTSIELGSELGPDGRVSSSAAKTTFAPSDTIYASVAPDNAPAATLSARWTFEDGQLVDETQQTVAATDSATEFHVAKPDGFPAGRYRVEIALNGKPAGTREFEVR